MPFIEPFPELGGIGIDSDIDDEFIEPFPFLKEGHPITQTLPEPKPPTILDGAEEKGFQKWYKKFAKKLGWNPNPSSPDNIDDHREKYLAGEEPVEPEKEEEGFEEKLYAKSVETIKKAAEHIVPTLKEIGMASLEVNVGFSEAVTTLAQAVTAMPVSALVYTRGLFEEAVDKLVLGKPIDFDRLAEEMHEVQQKFMPIQPKTQFGKTVTEVVASPFGVGMEALEEVSKYGASAIEDIAGLNPEETKQAEDAIKGIGEALFLLTPFTKGLRGNVRAKIRNLKMPEAYYRMTVKEKALAIRTMQDMKNLGYTDAQIGRMPDRWLKKEVREKYYPETKEGRKPTVKEPVRPATPKAEPKAEPVVKPTQVVEKPKTPVVKPKEPPAIEVKKPAPVEVPEVKAPEVVTPIEKPVVEPIKEVTVDKAAEELKLKATEEVAERQAQVVDVHQAPAKAEGITTKEQKNWLADEVSDAIKKAPEEDTGKFVKFEVPGDGVFTIKNNKATLEQFKKNVKARFDKDIQVKQTVPKPQYKPSQRRPSVSKPGDFKDFEYGKPYVPKKPPAKYGVERTGRLFADKEWFTTGHYVVKGKVPKGFEPDPMPEQLKDVMKRADNAHEAEIVGEYHAIEAQTYKVLVSDGKIDLPLNAESVDVIMEYHPDAKPYIVGAKQPVFFKKGSEVVGAVMPMAAGDFKYERNLIEGGRTGQEPTGGTTAKADRGGYAEGAKGKKRYDVERVGVELPEIVEIAKDLMAGKVPKIKKQIRAMGGTAGGVFYPGRGTIDLAAGIFKNADEAAFVLGHEVGHLVDWLPDKDISRGNILGRIASLKRYRGNLLEEYPGAPDKVLTPEDRARIRKESERIVREAAKEDEVIKVKVLINKEVPVTAEDMLKIWNDVAGAVKDPKLNDYIARLSSAEKKSILVAALKGMVPDWVTFKRQMITGYKTVEKVIRHTKESIDYRQKYYDMIREEIIKRGLYERWKVTDELKNLTQKLKPFEESRNIRYTKYRYSSVELYADSITALINNPTLLKEVAPTFHKAFFSYFERKPDLLKKYEEIQERMKDRTTIYEKREGDIINMFEKDRELQEERAQVRPMKILEGLYEDLVDKNADLIHRYKQFKKDGMVIDDVDNPRYWIEELPYISDIIYAMQRQHEYDIVRNMEKDGITLDDFELFRFYERILNERTDIANPKGHTVETVKDQLAHLKKRIGDKAYGKLEGYRDRAWEIRNEYVIPVLEESQMLSDALQKKVKENKFWATFDLQKEFEKKHGKHMTGFVYHQMGSLHDIKRPYRTSIMKDAALVRAAEVTIMKQKVVEFLKKTGDDVVTPAKKVFRGGRHELVEPKDPNMGLIAWMHKGKMVGYYAPKAIAENFQLAPYEAGMVLKAWRALNVPLREILVGRNPVWSMANIVRDFIGTAKNIEGLNAPTLIKYYVKAFREAYLDVAKGIPTETVTKMLKDKMLVTDRHFSAMDIVESERHDKMLQDFGKKPVRYRNIVVRNMVRLWDILGKFGKFSERWGKIAGYKYLTENTDLSRKRIAHLVRARVATPDIYRGGRLLPIYNNIFLFSNVAIQGWRASLKAAKEAPWDYAWKTVKYNIIPKAILAAVGAGVLKQFGDDEDKYKKIVGGASEYHKENYMVIPLGTYNDKSMYLTIPQDYTGQVIGGIMWNLMQGKITGKGSTLSYTTEQTPYNLNPFIAVGVDAIQYLRGKNIYDAYRDSNVIPDIVQRARGTEKGDREARKILGKHIFNNLGGTILYKFTGPLKKPETVLEKFLRVPIGNILGRFLRISDQGVREEAREVTEKIRAEKAATQLELRDQIQDHINERVGERTSKFQIRKLYEQLKRDDLIHSAIKIRVSKSGKVSFTYGATASAKQFEVKYRRYESKTTQEAEIQAVIFLPTKDEQIALLKHYKKSLPPKDFNRIRKQLLREGHISPGTAIHVNMKER